MPKKAAQPKSAEITQKLDDDMWMADEAAGPGLGGRLVAEFVGTAMLVLGGLGIALFGVAFAGAHDSLAVGLGFGLTVTVLILVIGNISGAHVNPAVTVGLWLGGRFPGRDVALYAVAQTAGAIAGGGILAFLMRSLATTPPDANGDPDTAYLMSYLSIGFGAHSPSVSQTTGEGIGAVAAFFVEFIAAGILVAVVLAATSKRAPKGAAPWAIGLTLALLITMFGIFTNASLNPARATATAVWAWSYDGWWALKQLGLWWAAGLFSAALVGLLFRGFGPLEDIESASDDAGAKS